MDFEFPNPVAVEIAVSDAEGGPDTVLRVFYSLLEEI